ncbi:protein phosphatase 2C domain-containing protein [Nannocystis sp. ncelm1]|uniref:Protein phosphatase 2C domain-containing protein n=2 Tax=Nannocystis radixulma TaxID=2995305 RepID=A0ABT5BAK0_9BACT|nr:protein phosphatase 2C domain-containing protein [Nannocystis radixulma]
MEIKHWAATDVGRKRSHNEDNFLIDKNLNLFIVADGMGGHASGEVASALAVHTIRDVVSRERDLLTRIGDFDATAQMELCTLLEYAVHSASAHIYHKAQQEPEKRGMGTTVVALLIIGQRGFIAYVGDSRIYLSRNGVVYPLTEDHSLMNELIRSGKVRADEFAVSPYANFKNAMTRAVGVYEHVEVDILDFEILPGDAFLLCSDGLYDYLDDAEIASNLALSNIEDIPGRFIDLANSRGGKDNVTALAVQVRGDATRAAQLQFTVETLRGVKLFEGLTYQQLCKLMNISRVQACHKGEVLAREGEEPGDLFVVLDGRATLSRGGNHLATVDAGTLLGETDLVGTDTARITITVENNGKLLRIGRRDLQELLRRDHALASRLLWSLATDLGRRLADAQGQLARALGDSGERTMVVDVSEAEADADADVGVDVDTDETESFVETNPRGLVIPKLTSSKKAEPELVEEIEEIEDVMDDGA